MGNQVKELTFDHLKVAEELRKLADDIERGEREASTVVCIARDRKNSAIFTRVCGEDLSYSYLMGLCAYASAQFYKAANDG